MTALSFCRRITLATLLLLPLLWQSAFLPSFATDLPPFVLQTLQSMQATTQTPVTVRFDGLITFGQTGTSQQPPVVYLPVLPLDPAKPANPTAVMTQQPEGQAFPDVIGFDNGLYLIRVVQTESGKQALAKLTPYPSDMKEGLLPQDLVLPRNLYIPAELKVILGDLPYNPDAQAAPTNDLDLTATGLDNNPTATAFLATSFPTLPSTLIAKNITTPARPLKQVVYAVDQDKHRLLVLDSAQKQVQNTVALDCVVSRLAMDSSRQLAFAPCASASEVIVVDSQAHVVRGRVDLSARPYDVVVLPQQGELLISHRYANYLSVVDVETLTEKAHVLLPGQGGVMQWSASLGRVVIADSSKASVYVLNPESKTVEQTWTGLAETSAMTLVPAASSVTSAPTLAPDGLPIATEPTATATPPTEKLWMVSRNRAQLQVVDMATGKVANALETAEKPVALYRQPVAEGEPAKVWVVSAGTNSVEGYIISPTSGMLEKQGVISLPEGSFPTEITASPNSANKAWVACTGSNQLIEVDFTALSLAHQWGINGRPTAVMAWQTGGSAAVPTVVFSGK